MSVLQAIFLGLVQGLTEFLPVSSSGHLVILQSQLGMEGPQLLFDILLHTGTLAAIIICYRLEVWNLLKALLSYIAPGKVTVENQWRRLLALIIVSFVPTGIIGYLIGEKLEWVFASPLFAASMLLITGTFLRFTGLKKVSQRAVKSGEKLSARDSFVVGVAQGIAVLPGISRSGATISTGLFMGFSREEAVRFSFLMLLPATAAAQIWSLRGDPAAHGMAAAEWPAYLAGAAVAFLTGYVALKKLIRITARGKLHLFSYYCWAVGALAIAFLLF